MPTKIRIIASKDFIEVTPAGVINVATSRKLLMDIAKVDSPPADYELFVDFRHTECILSITEVYQLAAELFQHGDTFHRKIALLVMPGLNFDRASFFETCSRNRGYQVNAFTDYEEAMRWILSDGDDLINAPAATPADKSNGK